MNLKRTVRAREWWSYKLPPPLAVAYTVAYMGDVPADTGLVALAAFLVFLTATASFGYFVNDLFDMDVDRAAGKTNAAAALDRTERGLILLGSLALALAPWLILPTTPGIVALVAAELGLLVVYAAPPLRLKTRGSAALVADGLYAHTLPALIAALTFSELGAHREPAATVLLVALATWSFAIGVRGILLHQIDDLDADQEAGVRTVVDRSNRLAAVTFVVRGLIPLEVAALAAMTWALGGRLPLLALYTTLILLALGVRAHRGFGSPSSPAGARRENREGWHLENELSTQTRLLRQGAAARVVGFSSTAPEPWKIRLASRPVTLRAAAGHRLSLRLRADTTRAVEVLVTRAEPPWDPFSPCRSIQAGPELRRVVVPVLVADVDTPVRVQLNLAASDVAVEVSDLTLIRTEDDHDVLDDAGPDDSSFVQRRRFADFYGSGVLNVYYEQWLPLLPLAWLAVRDPVYGLVALAHVFAFHGPVRAALNR